MMLLDSHGMDMVDIPVDELVVLLANDMCRLIERMSDEDLAALYSKIDNKLITLPSGTHPKLLEVLSHVAQQVRGGLD